MEPSLSEKCKRVRLLATDLDGTLLNDEKQITPRTRAVVAEAMRRGYYFTFITGRQAGVMWQFKSAIPANAPLICSNGGELADPVSGEVLYRAVIDGGAVADFAAFCLTQGIPFLCRMPGLELVRLAPDHMEMMRARQRAALEAGQRPQELIELADAADSRLRTGSFIKLMAWPASEGGKLLLSRYCADDPRIDCTRSGANVFEIVPAGSDKGKGFAAAAERLGLTAEQCCAFGDYDNDLPSFRFAGMRVAMGNGNGAVKALADYITCDNEHDGVAAAIERLFLSGDGTRG